MIAVTGGAGFIGSNIIRGLNKRGVKNILVVDDLTNGEKHKNLNRLDFADYMDYSNFLEKIDNFGLKAVFHQGACSDTTQPDGKYMMENNYEFSKKLWNYCMKRDIRFFFASSASVYGDGKNGFRENAVCEYPLNVYAFSKYQFDRYLRRNWNISTSQTVSLRYYNVYGPQENHKGKMASVAFHLYNQVKSGQPMKLYKGSENFLRDFIYVDDVVDVNMFFWENPHLSGIYNCGTGKAESFQSIADAVKLFFNKASIDYIEFPEILKGKYQTYTCADISALRNDGYVKSFMGVGEGVKKYLEVLEQNNGYLV